MTAIERRQDKGSGNMKNGVKNKVLVVNADDLGLDVKINQGIVHSCCHGIVRSVSLVACGEAFEDAIERIQGLSGIGVGVYLCLTAEKPLLPVKSVSSLLGHQGRFLPSYREFLLRAACGRVCWEEAAMELEAQVRRVLEKGIRPTHLDGHQYIHLFPRVLQAVIRLCLKYDIKWIRYPARIEDRHDHSWEGLLKKAWVLVMRASQMRSISDNGLCVPDAVYGFLKSGDLDRQKLSLWLKSMREGRYDLTSHPGFYPEHVSYQRWGYHWKEELLTVTDPEMVPLLKGLHIRLGNYEKDIS